MGIAAGRAASPHRAILGIDMSVKTSWGDSRALRVALAVLMVLVGLFELIAKHTANHTAIGLMWLVVGIGWGIRCQFTPRESRKESLICVAMVNLLLGASYIAGSTRLMHIEFGVMWLVIGIAWVIRGLQTKESSLSILPPDEPGGVTLASASEPGPGRGISAQ